MPTRKLKLRGLAYWARVFEDNRDLTGYEDALKDVGGQTKIDVDLDDENYEKLKQARSMTQGKPSVDNEGMNRVTLKRKWQEKFGGGAPVVMKSDGSEWDYYEDGPIGNGSVVEVYLSVYDTSRKSIVGTRLDKVKVLEHIPYDPESAYEGGTSAEVKEEKSKADTKEIDDEIPF